MVSRQLYWFLHGLRHMVPIVWARYRQQKVLGIQQLSKGILAQHMGCLDASFLCSLFDHLQFRKPNLCRPIPILMVGWGQLLLSCWQKICADRICDRWLPYLRLFYPKVLGLWHQRSRKANGLAPRHGYFKYRSRCLCWLRTSWDYLLPATGWDKHSFHQL